MEALGEPIESTLKGGRMQKKEMFIFIGVGFLVLLTGTNIWAQRPAEPQAGPLARAVLAPSSGPEQEAAAELNTILRSLHVVQEFFGIPEDVLDSIVEDSYEEMLGLLRLKHQLLVELRELMAESNPPPGLVGQLVMDIRELKAEIKVISQSWGDGIETVLDDEQLEKLEMVRRVALIIPAFKQVGLIPPPPPRVRPEDEQ